MRLFPLDLVVGSVLILSVLMIFLSLMIFRYRRGIGAVFSLVAGIWLILFSVSYVLDTFWTEIPVMVILVPLICGAFSLVLSAIFWRRGN